MKKVTLLIIIFWLLNLSGCLSLKIQPNTASILKDVCDRHDTYVEQDEGITTIRRDIFLMDTKVIRMFLEENSEN